MKTFALAASILALCALLAAAQDSPFGQPEKEHQWLEHLVGDWVTVSEANAVPGQPPVQCQGTISTRKLGGFWIVCEVTNNMMGTTMNAVQTVGYDPEKKKYVGTWVDSMMNHMWKYEGSVDASGKVLTLQAEGPNFESPGKTAQFRDVYEVKGPDEIVTTSQMQGADGKWVTFATGTAKRKGK